MPSSALIDTSVVLRYLVGRPAEQAEHARDLLDGRDGVALTPLLLAESAWVLESYYEVPREAVVDVLVGLLQKSNVELLELSKAHAIEALLLCRPAKRVSFTDALVWASAREYDRIVYSFDRRFPASGIEVRHPHSAD